MDEARVLGLLTRINTWWDGDPVPRSLRKADHRRRDFDVLRRWLDEDREVITICGARQVGKTTVAGQLIDSLLNDDGLEPERILYINMENSQFLSNPEDTIKQSLDVYEDVVLGKSFQRFSGEVFVFIDEIQKMEGWAETVKYYTDTFANLRFVVTGSVSTLIDDEANETLVGRLSKFTMYPMKYIEHVRYREVGDDDRLNRRARGLRESLRDAVRTGNAERFYSDLAVAYGRLEPFRPELTTVKNDYLLKGGYPAVLDMDYVDAFNRLDSDIRSTVTGDIPSVFTVQKPEKLLRMFNLIGYSSGQKISIQSLADSTGLNRETVEEYLKYLEEFFLVNRSSKYSTSEYGRRGKEKMYVQDVGHLNTLEGTLGRSVLDNSEQMGKMLETACRDLAARLQYFLSGHRDGSVEYWDGRGEVDLVLSNGEYELPIEVKRGDTRERSLRGLRNFIDEYHVDFGFAVNDSGALKHDKNDVIHIPAWLFFYIC